MMPDIASILARPTRFDQVVGQDHVTSQLASFIKQGKPPCILIAGPTGVGKSSLASIYARSAMCPSPKDGSCCGTCPICRAPSSIDLMQIDAARDSSIETIAHALANLDNRPWDAKAKVLWIDEAQGLGKASRDALLVTIENARPDQVVIVTLIDETKLPREFADRFHRYVLLPPKADDATRFLIQRAEIAGVKHDADALPLLGHYSTGFRKLGRWLQQLADAHPDGITSKAVRDFLLGEVCGESFHYLNAAMCGDLQLQLDVIASTSLAPAEQAASILDLLNFIKITQVGPSTAILPSSPCQHLLSPDDIAQLVQLMDLAAERFNLPLSNFLSEVQAFWAAVPTSITQRGLVATITRFHDQVNFTALHSLSAAPAIAMATEPKRSSKAPRTIKAPSRVPANATYITSAQAKGVYEASTFMIQQYGVAFNAEVEFSHAALGIRAEDQAVAVTSAYAKGLAERFRDWAHGNTRKSQLHRLIWHMRLPATLRSSLIFHLPQEFEGLFAQWHDNYVDAHTGKAVAEFLPVPSVDHGRNYIAKASRHWQLVRPFWGTLDPALGFEGKSLADHLKVPADLRQPAGVWAGHRYSLSNSIGKGRRSELTRARRPHLSAWCGDGWAHMFSGWEFLEHDERNKLMDERSRDLEQLRRRHGGSDQLTKLALKRMEEALAEDWPSSARARKRSRWKPWWLCNH